MATYHTPINFSSSNFNAPAGNFTANINPGVPLDIRKKNKIALQFFQIWNTSPNISAALNNNVIQYYNGVSIKTVVFPDAGYQIADICNFFNQQVGLNGDNNSSLGPGDVPNTNYITLSPFLSTTTQVIVAGTYELILNAGAAVNMANVLGFLPLIYPNGTYPGPLVVGQNQANITGISSFTINIDNVLTGGSSYTGNPLTNSVGYGSAIWQDSFSNGFGSLYKLIIPERFWLNVAQIPLLTSIKVTILDQNGKIIDFGQNGNYQNNPSSFTLLISSD
jgi:hypothetical protein